MQSLTTASEILSRLKELTDGMALIRQDVDTLKQASSLHGGNNLISMDYENQCTHWYDWSATFHISIPVFYLLLRPLLLSE